MIARSEGIMRGIAAGWRRRGRSVAIAFVIALLAQFQPSASRFSDLRSVAPARASMPGISQPVLLGQQGCLATGASGSAIVGSFRYYWYSATGSVTFTSGPTATCAASVLQCGPAGGGGFNIAGSGGAGVCVDYTALNFTVGTPYAVTVGTKGTGSNTANVRGNPGSGPTSIVHAGGTLSTSEGAGGGSGPGAGQAAGGNAGNGGGGNGDNAGAGGTGTVRNGSAGSGAAPSFGAGAGACYTAAGGVASGTNGAAGCDGLSLDAATQTLTPFAGCTKVGSSAGGGILSTGTAGVGGGQAPAGSNSSATPANATCPGDSGAGGGRTAPTTGGAGSNGMDGIVVIRVPL